MGAPTRKGLLSSVRCASAVYLNMTLFSLVFALLLDQFRVLSRARVQGGLQSLAAWGRRQYDDGGEANGRWAWWIVVGGASLAVLVVHWLLSSVSWVLGFGFSVLVLWGCMGFRDVLDAFSDVHLALSTGDNERAAGLLARWRGEACQPVGSGETARLAIETLLIGSHRQAFGVIFWFVLLPGPVGAAAYRLCAHLAAVWRKDGDGDHDRFGQHAHTAFEWVDALPVRLTALFYSVLGNFEDALYCWRAQSVLWPDRLSGILIASGAGALGVRLGLPIHGADCVVDRPEMGTGGAGHKADTLHMQRAAQLVWRVLWLWLLLLALFGVAGLMSG